MSNIPKPVVLAILDGWGIAPPSNGNATTLAKTPNITALKNAFVHTQLIAHGESVGLPKREPGNTETGHLNIGAGSIVYQDLPRINMSIADGSFFQNPQLIQLAEFVRQSHGRVHLLGLVGGGGVHSDLSHFFALLRFCREQALSDVYIHAFTDGRDSPPTSSATYIQQLDGAMAREHVGHFASVMGRYYAMDRDFRWDRTQKAYDCLTQVTGKSASTIQDAITHSYAQNLSDEFIEPTLILDSQGNPTPRIADNDAIIFVNFRIDRPRQLTKAFVLPQFEQTANTSGFDPYSVEYNKKHVEDNTELTHRPKPFQRQVVLKNISFLTMTEYEKNLPVKIIFPPQAVDYPISRAISEHELRQMHMAESEKERFVTYYFNGLREQPFQGEDRLIVASPKVATYDKKPEMSARELNEKVIDVVKSGMYHFIVVNFANADMVGHTGNIKACIAACEVVDECIGKLSTVVIAAGGVLAITADHGNAEEMVNQTTGTPDTEHNANPVPMIFAGNSLRKATQIPQGILADIAPTLLILLGVPVPVTMTGRNLLAGVTV